MSTAATPFKKRDGASQREFAQKAAAERELLDETGQCKPFSIVNFNPVPLTLSGELSRYRVPSPIDERLPKDVSRITIGYQDKPRVGHVLTPRHAHIFGRMSNATGTGAPGEVLAQREVRHMLPSGIAYSFLEHYSPIFVTRKDGMATAPPTDARKIYGVMAFEGDVHTLAKLCDGDEMDEDATINVPVAKVIQGGTKIYNTIPYRLGDYLKNMFDGQLRYAKAKVMWAQGKANGSAEEMKEIDKGARIWLEFLIALGRVNPKTDPSCVGRHAWRNEISDSYALAELEGLRKCPACKAYEPEADTPFCQKCNAPMDVFKTFMAGHVVSEAHLATLKGEQLEIALEEHERRSSIFGRKAQRGPYKSAARGAAMVATTDGSIPEAESTALPGEEDEDDFSGAANGPSDPGSAAHGPAAGVELTAAQKRALAAEAKKAAEGK